jgi:threonine dehydrogenase-like Zn-dependent dehydrogenase
VRAAVVGAGGQYEVVTLPNPSPGPGELLLRVTACGLCGSDLKARMAMPRGTIMGHEFGGEVIARSTTRRAAVTTSSSSAPAGRACSTAASRRPAPVAASSSPAPAWSPRP